MNSKNTSRCFVISASLPVLAVFIFKPASQSCYLCDNCENLVSQILGRIQ